ncbi:alpha/beta hydrolase [Paraconexibacter antarcticus]|uniref:Alpha/beta hydrolase n=1 Tax=Paraconexibacter antarcticus TaxID=2949664 RepID=A0ABY5DRJ3_9ACTN|nr:alpha/beta hydrolase [Paraconexibacter antarcticus]UTI63315.1 alpha/beta hydrolase [Paraconexibacter antarcticus]
MLLAHGFGCDQQMWRRVWPAFEERYRLVLFDHVGAGGSDVRAFDPDRYSSLEGYADDVIAICEELDLRDVIFVGHSVSAMIGVLAAARSDRIARLVLVGPSARYLDDVDYEGGFTRPDIEDMLRAMESNYLGWSSVMAPAIMGSDQPEALRNELTESFCRADPAIARHFARLTFLSDNRADLQRVTIPSLVLQCREDVIAPTNVGKFVSDALAGGELVLLEATGHCPNVSAPDEVNAAIWEWLER